jgi:hypothetical protein
MSEMLFPDLFLTCDILLLIRKPVLWQQVSHLFLKYTESGYETVLTAACARQ